MQFDEIFGGMTFTSDTSQAETPNARRLDTIDLSSIVQAEIERGSDLSAPYSMLGFNVLIKEYDARSITFKFKFEHPLSVSVGSEPDQMFMKFIEPDLFIAKDTGEPLDLGDQENIKTNLPRQFPDKSIFESIGSAGVAVQVAS